MHIAFNGWPLVAAEEPDAALHLRDLLERLPALSPRHRYTLLLPGEPALPSWQEVAIVRVGRRRGEWGRLWLEQRGLVRAAVAARADVLYFPYAAAPISSPVPVAAWCGCAGNRPIGGGPAARLRATLAEAGLSGAAGLIHTEDAEPLASSGARHLAVPPMVPRAFSARATPRDRQATGRYDLPQTYVLSDGGGSEDVGLLLGAWTWVASAMGDAVSLVVVARGSTARRIRSRVRASDLLASVLVLEDVRAEDVPAIYGDAEGFLFAGWGCSGEAVRRALASGLAVTGTETAESSRVVGMAGYLVPGRDARRLGAACLTLLVEPDLSERLREAARRRGTALTSNEPLRALLSHLERVAERPRLEG